MTLAHPMWRTIARLSSLCLLLLAQLLPGSTATAQSASLEGATLTIPSMQAGSDYYTVQLTLIPGSNPLQLSLASIVNQPTPDLQNLSIFANNVLSVPSLAYEGTNYSLEIGVASLDPPVLQLNSATPEGSAASGASFSIDGDNFQLQEATPKISYINHDDGLWGFYENLGFKSMIELEFGEDCTTSSAPLLRMEALSKKPLWVDNNSTETFTLDDFDKIDLFYLEGGRPKNKRNDYCPPSTSLDWTTKLSKSETRDANHNLTVLDFTKPPAANESYHAANHGGYVVEFYPESSLTFPFLGNTLYKMLAITALEVKMTVFDNNTNYQDFFGQDSDDTATIEVNASFTDYDGSERSLSTVMQASGNDAKVHFPYMPPGDGIEGCWAYEKVDAWCFYGTTGQYIQYTLNGNPGTLYIDFNYSANLASKTLTTTYTRQSIVGSCCDKTETIQGNPQSATFQRSRNVFSLDGRDYIYTRDNLGL